MSKSGFFEPPSPLKASMLTLLHGGGGLKSAVKIRSHRLQINKLDICIMKGCFIFQVLNISTRSYLANPPSQNIGLEIVLF